VPAKGADDAELHDEERRHCDVVDAKDDVDTEALEVGRPAEGDRQVDVLIRGQERRCPLRQPPADEQGGEQRGDGADHREVR
jgi:hypothetical protein